MQKIIDLLYPRRCPICDEVLFYGGEKICAECKEKPIYLKEPVCKKCGKPFNDQTLEYCEDCILRNHHYKEGAGLFLYRSVKTSIYRFKYSDRQEYADYYAEEMVGLLGNKISNWGAQALVPVPLHEKRLKARGYNQSAVLAQEISRKTGIPVYDNLVKRIKNTIPQKQLDEVSRQNNLKRAFKICENKVKLDTIIIIDDIYTTGSTINALAICLRDAGVKNIYFLTLAIGQF